MKINNDSSLNNILNYQANANKKASKTNAGKTDESHNKISDQKLNFQTVLDDSARRIVQAKELIESGQIDDQKFAESAAQKILKFGI